MNDMEELEEISRAIKTHIRMKGEDGIKEVLQELNDNGLDINSVLKMAYELIPDLSPKQKASLLSIIAKITGSNYKDNSGIIYILKCDCFYKIGKTTDENTLKNRLGHLQVGSPFEIKIYKTKECDDRHKLEEELHDRFKGKLTRGEWFKLTDEDINNVF